MSCPGSQEWTDRVRDAVDMIGLVGEKVELRRTGANRLTGLCPFHDEHEPSFGIDPAQKLYHCFGCGAGGDAFRFVMESESVDFDRAVALLACRFIDWPGTGDCCPDCGAHAWPRTVSDDGPSGVQADYTCPCGHRWSTWWSVGLARGDW